MTLRHNDLYVIAAIHPERPLDHHFRENAGEQERLAAQTGDFARCRRVRERSPSIAQTPDGLVDRVPPRCPELYRLADRSRADCQTVDEKLARVCSIPEATMCLSEVAAGGGLLATSWRARSDREHGSYAVAVFILPDFLCRVMRHSPHPSARMLRTGVRGFCSHRTAKLRRWIGTRDRERVPLRLFPTRRRYPWPRIRSRLSVC